MIESIRILTVDPGKSGGLSYYNGFETVVRKFTTESELLDFLRGLKFPEEVHCIVEDVPRFVSSATSSSSSFKLGYNYGFYMGALRSIGFKVDLVKPQVWQKGLPGLRPKIGYTLRKRILKDIASRLFPKIKVTHAVADALLILDWYTKSKSIVIP